MIEKNQRNDTLLAEFGAVVGLFGLGVAYNALVEWLGKNGYSQGYTSIMVVVGTTVVLLFSLPLIGAKAFMKLLALFAAAGAPMAFGDMVRHARNRREFQEWRYEHTR